MHNRLLIASLAASSLLVGCAADVGSEEDARAGWAPTNTALAAGASSAQSSSAGAVAPDENPVLRAGNAVSVNYDHSCSSGSINYNGNYFFDASDIGSTVEFDYQADFDKCSDGSLTIDGSLDYALSADASDAGSNLTYTYSGELVWSGSVEGSCAIDMTGVFSATSTSAGVSYSGKICGFDAAVTLNVSV